MDNIRNVCILAHVDHGKTSLADILISPSGVISQRSAGDLRFMDSTTDEQTRGITMKSSAISLSHNYHNKLKGDNEEKKRYFINLIDSPGHVDFSGEVSTAVKIADNAFLLVDVVEGVCPQTRTVLTQAWKEGLSLILVLNKIDKLHSELKLTTTAAYSRLLDIIQDVHHLVGELISQDVKEEEEKYDLIISKESISERYDTLPFHPLKGRVIFCSAFHHWGFRISDFVDVYSKLLEIDKQELYKKMWGDFYLNGKKNIIKGAISSNRKNIFTSLILDQIWNVYNALDMNDIPKVINMMTKLNINVIPKKNVNESASQLLNIRHVLNSWMPLCTVLLDTLIEKCPNPRAAITDKKIQILVPNDKFVRAREILKSADVNVNAPMVTFISKVMLQQNGNEEFISNELIAFGRIYSGFMKPGMKVFLFSPRFNPHKVKEEFFNLMADDFEEGPINVYEEDNKETSNLSDVYVFKIKQVFLFIGQDTLVLENGTSAGHIIGITGLDWHTVHKNGTIVGKCSLYDSLGMFSQYDTWSDDCNNIICVSIVPKKSAFLKEVEEALKLLEKSDPIVDAKFTQDGEMLLYAAGEIHLQKCLNDLQTRIIPEIELDISPPIVPFRETILHRAVCDMSLFSSIETLSQELKENKSYVISIEGPSHDSKALHQGISESSVVYIRIPQKCGMKLCVRISVHSLPKCIVEWIEKNSLTFFRLTKAKKRKDELSKCDSELKSHLFASLKMVLEEASKEEKELCANSDTAPIDYSSMLEQFWTIGDSQTTQGNMLFSYIDHWGLFTSEEKVSDVHSTFYLSIVKGFQRALRSGPICQEPIKNVAFIIHDLWEMTEETTKLTDDNDNLSDDDDEKSAADVKYEYNVSMENFVSNKGQVSNSITKGCQVVLMSHPGARLMIATYKLDIEIRINMFKNLNSIIKQLHGDVIQQEVNVGNFIVEARIPVIESFGFGDKLRKKTSGEVSLPQLKTVLWEVLDCSPLLDSKMYGTITDKSDECNIGIAQELVTRTQSYLNSVRLRKGLHIRKQMVEYGDKQRTLCKKK